MNIIIVGDKYQKGMKSKGCAALIKSKNRHTIIEQQYNVCKNIFPDSKIIYVGGFEFKKIQLFLNENTNIDIELIYNDHYEKYNDVYSLSLVSDYFDNDVLITFGYNLLSNSTFKNFIANDSSKVFIDQNSCLNIGCVIQNGVVSNITYDLPNSISNLYYLNKPDANVMAEYLTNEKYYNHFLFELINNLIDKNTTIHPHYINHHKTLKGQHGYNKIK